MLILILLFAGFKPMLIVAGSIMVLNLIRLMYLYLSGSDLKGKSDFKQYPFVTYLVLYLVAGLKPTLLVLFSFTLIQFAIIQLMNKRHTILYK